MATDKKNQVVETETRATDTNAGAVESEMRLWYGTMKRPVPNNVLDRRDLISFRGNSLGRRPDRE
jgi:hypothetical protein